MAERTEATTWRVWEARGVQRLVRVAPCPYGGTLWRTGLHEVPACAVMEHAAARGWDVRRLEVVSNG